MLTAVTQSLTQGALWLNRQSVAGSSVVGWFSDDNVVSTIGKEVVGINAPKATNVRRFGEFLDAMVSELGNTVGYFGGGYALDAIMNRLKPRLVGSTADSSMKQALTLFHTGKSIAFMAILGSFIWAMPFFRNVVTANKLGTTKFTEIISGNALLAQESKQAYESNKQRFWRTGWSILGAGAAIGLGAFALLTARSGRLASQLVQTAGKAPVPQWIQKLVKATEWKEPWFTRFSFLFEGGQFKKLNRFHAFWFWGLPAYGGWFHASREPEERGEIVFKAINFFVMFFGVGPLLTSMLRRPAFFGKPLLEAFKAYNKANPKKPLAFGKEAFEVLNAQNHLGLSAQKIEQLEQIRLAHKTIGYFASTAALFVSNWWANNLSQWATEKRMAPKRSALGQQAWARLQQSAPLGSFALSQGTSVQ
ncbi:MAG: hypothetical protein U0003_00780 [Vampirovibrionales bacterium]